MYCNAMTTRLLVGMLTPAIRATAHAPFRRRDGLEADARRLKHPRRPVEAGPCQETAERKKSHAHATAPGPRTRSGWRVYRAAARGRQQAPASIGRRHARRSI